MSAKEPFGGGLEASGFAGVGLFGIVCFASFPDADVFVLLLFGNV